MMYVHYMHVYYYLNCQLGVQYYCKNRQSVFDYVINRSTVQRIHTYREGKRL